MRAGRVSRERFFEGVLPCVRSRERLRPFSRFGVSRAARQARRGRLRVRRACGNESARRECWIVGHDALWAAFRGRRGGPAMLSGSLARRQPRMRRPRRRQARRPHTRSLFHWARARGRSDSDWSRLFTFRRLDAGILENAVQQPCSDFFLRVHRQGHDAFRDGVPEVLMAPFAAAQLFKAVLLEQAYELGPCHSGNLRTKRWVLSNDAASECCSSELDGNYSSGRDAHEREGGTGGN